MSRVSLPTETGKPVVFRRTGRLVLAETHFLISECPSAKEKPQALTPDAAGRSLQAERSDGSAAVQNTNQPSLMLSGCSSRKTKMPLGLRKSVILMNCLQASLMGVPWAFCGPTKAFMETLLARGPRGHGTRSAGHLKMPTFLAV